MGFTLSVCGYVPYKTLQFFFKSYEVIIWSMSSLVCMGGDVDDEASVEGDGRWVWASGGGEYASLLTKHVSLHAKMKVFLLLVFILF
jgi:hypothetical protein